MSSMVKMLFSGSRKLKYSPDTVRMSGRMWTP
jgi:hypothetical protein